MKEVRSVSSILERKKYCISYQRCVFEGKFEATPPPKMGISSGVSSLYALIHTNKKKKERKKRKAYNHGYK